MVSGLVLKYLNGECFVIRRLARSVQHLGQIIERINSVGASLVILDMGGTAVDTSNPTGKLILNVMSSVAQF